MNINRYEVKIVTKPGIIYKEVGSKFQKTSVEILSQNSKRYCLDDEYYTTMEKERCDYRASVDEASISSRVNDSCWGTSLDYVLYTFKNKRKSTIKREIEEHIDLKFGGFSNINLDFLDEVD